MSKDANYRRLIQSAEWRNLRAWKLTQNPTCEVCGIGTPARCVHHLTPVESAHTAEKMAELCFSMSNLQSLCYECHSAIHKAERSHSREQHQQRASEALERWKARRSKTPGPIF